MIYPTQNRQKHSTLTKKTIKTAKKIGIMQNKNTEDPQTKKSTNWHALRKPYIVGGKTSGVIKSKPQKKKEFWR